MPEEMKALLTAHADRERKLTVQRLSARQDIDDAEDTKSDYVIIEGDEDSLRFLGRFLIAFADGDFGCNWDLHPDGPGSSHFSPSSTLGIYFHKLPCDCEDAWIRS